LAAPTPTPGGGSAAAYAGAMAAGLVSMVARLTIDKKGYSEVEAAMNRILEESEILRNDLTSGVIEDSEAFDRVMAAYKIPKSDPARAAAIQEATLLATQVPLEAAKKSYRVAELALEAAQSGNKNAITDAGSAVNLAIAAVNSAAYNVRINLADLNDHKQKEQILSELGKIEEGVLVSLDKIKTILTDRGGLFS
jgi:formiminotetrahydrofolate cyclodeaminase